MNDLQKVDGTTDLGLLQADSPTALVSRATEMATALADVIRSRELASDVGGKKYVRCEGWTTLAAMCGVVPQEVSNEPDPEGTYTATVELIRMSTGQVIGRASAECGGPEEPMWNGRAPYARRSMAATRATGKACRLCFSWIMVLAGYQATPAEEMTQEGTRGQTLEASAGDTIGFGKHKGEAWADIPSGYLQWLSEKGRNEDDRERARKELDARMMNQDQDDRMAEPPPHTDDEVPF